MNKLLCLPPTTARTISHSVIAGVLALDNSWALVSSRLADGMNLWDSKNTIGLCLPIPLLAQNRAIGVQSLGSSPGQRIFSFRVD